MNREKSFIDPNDAIPKRQDDIHKERMPFEHIPEELALELREMVEDLVKRKQMAQQKLNELEDLRQRQQLIVETINVVLTGFQQLEERQ